MSLNDYSQTVFPDWLEPSVTERFMSCWHEKCGEPLMVAMSVSILSALCLPLQTVRTLCQQKTEVNKEWRLVASLYPTCNPFWKSFSFIKYSRIVSGNNSRLTIYLSHQQTVLSSWFLFASPFLMAILCTWRASCHGYLVGFNITQSFVLHYAVALAVLRRF